MAEKLCRIKRVKLKILLHVVVGNDDCRKNSLRKSSALFLRRNMEEGGAFAKKKRINWQPSTVVGLLRFLIEKYDVYQVCFRINFRYFANSDCTRSRATYLRPGVARLGP